MTGLAMAMQGTVLCYTLSIWTWLTICIYNTLHRLNRYYCACACPILLIWQIYYCSIVDVLVCRMDSCLLDLCVCVWVVYAEWQCCYTNMYACMVYTFILRIDTYLKIFFTSRRNLIQFRVLLKFFYHILSNKQYKIQILELKSSQERIFRSCMNAMHFL